MSAAPIVFSSLIGWIIFLAILIKIFAALGVAKGVKSARQKKAPRLPRSSGKSAGAAEKLRRAAAKAEGKSSLRESSIFLEDRENDWLARQMREEAKVLSRSDMLDLGARHDRDCDARALKRAHELEHDDSCDDGEYSS